MQAMKLGSLAVAMALTGCGGGSSSGGSSDSSTTPDNTQTGVFTDSAVANIYYETETKSGYTNAAGEFEYVEGETVTFRIGGIELPSVEATGRVTPATMTSNASSGDQLPNILRLLQTLDEDGNPDNGITITDNTHQALENAVLDVNQSAAAFETQYGNEVEISTNAPLITAQQAENHFYESQQADLRGSWLFVEPDGESSNGNGPNGEEINVLTFLEDGRYILAHKYGNDDQGAATAEWGTYTWNPATGLLNVTVTGESEGGEGGLCPSVGSCSETVELVGGELHFASEEGVATPFQAVESSDNPNVGAWFLAEGSDFNVLTILDASHYVVAHNANGEVYSGSDLVEVSSEWGTYTISNDTFQVTGVETETDGPGGLYDASGNEGLTAAFDRTAYGELRLTPTSEDGFALRRIGRFTTELSDLAGNTSTVVVERIGGVFVPNEAKSFEYALVGEDDSARVTLQSNGTGSVLFVNDQETTPINAWSVDPGTGTLAYEEGDTTVGSWVFAPVKTSDGTEFALVDFRHVTGSTESLLGFYLSELEPVIR